MVVRERQADRSPYQITGLIADAGSREEAPLDQLPEQVIGLQERQIGAPKQSKQRQIERRIARAPEPTA